MTAHGEQAVPQFVIPETIADRYRVEREIGRGGMAMVYLCTDTRDAGTVAIKVLRPELASAVNVERFIREIGFASELDHPQIPRVLDSGLVSGLPFYAMTFIEGESLRARLDREKQLPVEEAIRITKEIISPTAYAHRLGIIHRDIKPANILLSTDRVYVLDFGVARAIVVSAGETLTSTGIAVGTPAYMSPEQALADHHLDTRSDIYSLGCVTYEMIAGIPPFVGATPQAIMSRRFVAAPPPLSEIRESVPQFVEDAVAKALCKAPADRWQTVQGYGNALDAVITPPSQLAVRARLNIRRRRMIRWIASAVGVTALAAGVWAWTTYHADPTVAVKADIARWDFDRAETRLVKAVAADNEDAAATVWLAQLQMLRGAKREELARLVLMASDRRDKLDSTTRDRLGALSNFASGRIGIACEQFEQLEKQNAYLPVGRRDITASLAFGDCLLADSTVVVDGSTASGFRFASSYAFADSLYTSLLTRHAATPASYAAIAPRLERLLATDNRMLRIGRIPGTNGGVFYSQPVLAGDSIAWIPYPPPPSGVMNLGKAEDIEAAFGRNAQRLRGFAERWVRVAPNSSHSHEMLAKRLERDGELYGKQSALSEIAVARRLATIDGVASAKSYRHALELTMSHVQLLIRTGAFGKAAATADTALALHEPADADAETHREATGILWRLAAIRGNLSRVISTEMEYAPLFRVRLPSGVESPPLEISEEVIRLNSFAAFGGPRDSILAVITRLETRLPQLVPPAKLKDMRYMLLARPLTLAAPIIGIEKLMSLGPTKDPVILAFIAFGRGQKRAAKQYLDSLTALHATRAPGEITMDVTYQEAWLSAQLGDSLGAARLLDNALGGISKAPPSMLSSPTLIASLVRAMRLRADIAQALGQSTKAKEWRNASFNLWGQGDRAVFSAFGRQ